MDLISGSRCSTLRNFREAELSIARFDEPKSQPLDLPHVANLLVLYLERDAPTFIADLVTRALETPARYLPSSSTGDGEKACGTSIKRSLSLKSKYGAAHLLLRQNEHILNLYAISSLPNQRAVFFLCIEIVPFAQSGLGSSTSSPEPRLESEVGFA